MRLQLKLLFGLDPVLFHDVSPFDDVSFDLGGEGFWCAADCFRALLGEGFWRFHLQVSLG